MDDTRYIQSKTKTLSNRNHLTNELLRNNYRKTRKNRDMLRVGIITMLTTVLIYSSITSYYAFAVGPDPHDICKKSGSCSCSNDPEILTATCCQGGKCMICEINTATGDFENCKTYDASLEQPPTSPNDNSGFPKGGVAEDPQTSPKVPINKGGVLAQ